MRLASLPSAKYVVTNQRSRSINDDHIKHQTDLNTRIEMKYFDDKLLTYLIWNSVFLYKCLVRGLVSDRSESRCDG